MKKKFNYLYLLVGLLFGVTILLTYSSNINIRSLSMDSGFDSSWDSGGSSSWSSSDWSSPSSYDWGSSSHNHSSSSSSADFSVYVFLLIIIIIFFIFVTSKDAYGKSDNDKPLYENIRALQDIQDRIPKFNKEEFYKMVYDKFIDIQKAWSRFDYDKLRTMLTDELYNTYKTQLRTLEIRKQTNIMTDFEKMDLVIRDFRVSVKEFTFIVNLRVKFYDYLVNKDNQKIRGSNLQRLVMTYELTFVKSRDINNQKPNKCPNCNAALENVQSNKCPYCNSTIISDNHDYIMSKKEAISQRFE